MLDPLGLYEYRVGLHVHSIFSDGTGTPEVIIREAHRAGLDVLWLTDHDTHRAAHEPPGPGYAGHLLFLVGTEVTPPTNHYLVFGDVKIPAASLGFQEIIDQVNEAGGVGFIAHPDDSGNRTARMPSYGWTDREVEGFTGLEIWNHVSDWSRQIHNFPQGIWAALHPFSGLQQAWRATLAVWDQWGSIRPVVAIGGTDAHAARVGFWPFRLTVFPYRRSFSGIRTHVYTRSPLSNDWRAAQSQLLEALRVGRVAVANAAIGGETGFRLWVERETAEPVPMGGTWTFSDGCLLRGLSPVPATWAVICNGVREATLQGTVMEHPLDKPGVWRVELWRQGAVWLYSNPLYAR